MTTIHIQPETKPVPAQKLSRRQWLSRLTALAALPAAGGYYANQIEPFWPRFPTVPIRLQGLAPAFENFRIAQVTDMHCGRVPYVYLQRVIAHVRELKPDLIVFTGDLLHHNTEMIEPVTRLMQGMPCPILISFGNHDYAPNRGEGEPCDPDLADNLQRSLTTAGCQVLRNSSTSISRGESKLWFVGLDDLWFGEFDPVRAFENLPASAITIALSHNPDTAEMLAPHRPDLILSGHTHGGQIRIPYFGALRLNVARPQYDMGHFHLPNSQLFVSTGVGYIRKVRLNCRPEVPIIVLRS